MTFVKISADFYCVLSNNEIYLRKGLIIDNFQLLYGKEALNLTTTEFSNFKFEYPQIFVALCLKKSFTFLSRQLSLKSIIWQILIWKLLKIMTMFIDFETFKQLDEKFAEIERLINGGKTWNPFSFWLTI